MRRLIASLPRAGTTYAWKVFESLGYVVAREAIEETEYDLRVSWLHIASGQSLLGTVQPSEWDIIVHMTREPLATIGSLLTIDMPTHFRYMVDVVGSPEGLNRNWVLLHKAMWVWLRWNELIESRANYSFKVEELGSKYQTVLGVLSLHAPSGYATFPEITINHRDHMILTWEDLKRVDEGLTTRIRNKAEQYGY